MIRPTRPEETSALVEMATTTQVFKPLEMITLQELLDDYHAGGTEAGHAAWTSEVDGLPSGFVYFAPTPMTDRTWHLYWICVAKSQHHRGIGAELLRHVEREIRQARGRLLLIETSSLPSYIPTRQFYVKHGYEQVAHVPDFYSDGDGQIIFRKLLG
jgi:ribosomal protein S18 acetylase RimI-like enzyme